MSISDTVKGISSSIIDIHTTRKKLEDVLKENEANLEKIKLTAKELIIVFNNIEEARVLIKSLEQELRHWNKNATANKLSVIYDDIYRGEFGLNRVAEILHRPIEVE